MVSYPNHTFPGQYNHYSVLAVSVYVWNFEFALQLPNMKLISFHYVRHPMRLYMLLSFPESLFISQNRLN